MRWEAFNNYIKVGMNMNERCECCDSEDVYTSYEKIEGYLERILVTHCDNCGLSYYKEPII